MPSPFLSDNVFVGVFGVFYLVYVAAALQSWRGRGREKQALEALAVQVAQRGWRWQGRPIRPHRPPGLDGDQVGGFLAWLITGTRGDQPWTLEQSRRRGRDDSSPRATFRGLLVSPPPYGLHILQERHVAMTSVVPGVAGILRRGITERARAANLDSAVPADDLASIVFPNAARRVAAPRVIDRLGYAALVTEAGAKGASIFLEQIAPVVAGWVQMNPDSPIDLMIFGAELQVSVRGVLTGFAEVERMLDLGLAALDAASQVGSG